MREKGIFIIILCSLVVILTLIDIGLFSTNRILVKNQVATLQKIQTQINNRDGQVQQLIGQLKATKTLAEVQGILSKIQ